MKQTLSFFLSFLLSFLLSCDGTYEAPIPDVEPEVGKIATYSYEDNTGATIGEIDFSIAVKDGMLEFRNIEDFTKATVAIDNSTDEMIKFWSEGIGHSSQLVEYINILDRFEALESVEPSFDKEFTQTELSQYQFILDEGAYWVKPKFKNRSVSALLNESGLVMINGALNYFSDDAHVLVIDGDKEKLNTALLNQSGTGLSDLIYTEQESGNIEKTNNKLVFCPSEGIAHRETLDKHRLVVELFTYIFPVHFSDEMISLNWTLRGKVYNYRKQGWTWRRTWTTLRLDVAKRIDYSMRLITHPWSDPSATSIVPGFPLIVTINPRIIGEFPDRSEIDMLLAARAFGLFDITTSNFRQNRSIITGRFRAFRTTGPKSTAEEGTAPSNAHKRLDITVGCNN